MKCWQRIALVVPISIISLLPVGTAFAQNGEEDPPIMSALLVPAQIVVKLAIMVNELFGFWVDGNYTLSDPLGEKLIGGLAVIFPEVTNFFAQILRLF